eukprot:223225_1
MNSNKSPIQIEGHQSAPPSPQIEGINNAVNTRPSPPPEPPKSPLFARDYDSMDSDNHEDEPGQQYEVIYPFGYISDDDDDDDIMNDNNSIHNSEISINMPQSPKKEIKKHKYRNKKNKQKRKRKLKHQNHSQAKRIKKEQIETVSLISDDENASNISYSVNDKDNPIY